MSNNKDVHAPTDAAERKALPIATGVLDYFPDALLAVADVSKKGNEQHNPGQPLHWAKEKSRDEADALLRHLLDRGKVDSDGVRHSAKVAWRALALLQREIEAERGYGYDAATDTWRILNEIPPVVATMSEWDEVPTKVRTGHEVPVGCVHERVPGEMGSRCGKTVWTRSPGDLAKHYCLEHRLGGP